MLGECEGEKQERARASSCRLSVRRVRRVRGYFAALGVLSAIRLVDYLGMVVEWRGAR